jgi:photosystem II stability/assembly factor-like uncharacterized protein
VSARIWAGTENGLWRAAIDPSAGTLGAWQEVGAPWTVRAIAVAPDGETLYVGAHDGVHVTRDQGETWTARATLAGGVWSIDVAPDAPERVVAGAAGAIYVSRDRGRTWRASMLTGAALGARVLGVACDRKRPARVLAAIDHAGVWRSDDDGKTFAAVELDALAVHGVAATGGGVLVVGRDGVRRGADDLPTIVVETGRHDCRSLAVALDAPDLVFVGAGGDDRGTILRSRDGGHHFELLELPVALTARVVAVALAPSDRCRIAAVTERGQLVLSVDCCTHWHTGELPVAAGRVHALAIT